MNNTFENMSDEEFLYQICAFTGKENFIRFIDIVSSGCPICDDGECAICEDSCGERWYKFLDKCEKQR